MPVIAWLRRHATVLVTALGVLLLAVAPHLPFGTVRAVLALAAMALVPGPAVAALVTLRFDVPTRGVLAAVCALAWYAGAGVTLHAVGGAITTAELVRISGIAGLAAAAVVDVAANRRAIAPGLRSARSHLPLGAAVASLGLVAALYPVVLPVDAPVDPPSFSTPVDEERPFLALALDLDALGDVENGALVVERGSLRLPVDVRAVGQQDQPGDLIVLVGDRTVARQPIAKAAHGGQRITLQVAIPEDGCEHRVVVQAGRSGPSTAHEVAVFARSGPAWSCRD